MMNKRNLYWYHDRKITDQEMKAIEEAFNAVGLELTDERVMSCIDDDSLTLNECRNGSYVVWYLDENRQACVYVDTLKMLDDDEISIELTTDELHDAAMEFHEEHIKKTDDSMHASFVLGWNELLKIMSHHGITGISLDDFKSEENDDAGLTDYNLNLRDNPADDRHDVYISYTIPGTGDECDSAVKLYENGCSDGYWSVTCYGEHLM